MLFTVAVSAAGGPAAGTILPAIPGSPTPYRGVVDGNWSHLLDGLPAQLRAVDRGDSPALETKVAQFMTALSTANALSVMSGLSDLSTTERKAGNYPASRVLMSRAVLIGERALGPDHPALAGDLAEQALQIYLSGDSLSAFEPALRAENSSREQLRVQLRTLRESAALRAAAARKSCLDLLITLGVIDDDPDITARVWDAVIRARCLVLDEMANRHRDILRAGDSSIVSMLDSLAAARGRYCTLLLSPADSVSRDYPQQVQAAREHLDQAESDLAVASRFYRPAFERGRAGFEETAAALPAGGPLVAFIRYRHLRRRRITEPGRPGFAVLDTVPSYAAFIAVPGGRGAMALRLGDAAGIDEKIDQWRDLATRPARDPMEETELDHACRAAGQVLRAAVWDPIARVLPDTTRGVEVVPDGALLMVDLEALPAPDGSYLIESGRSIHLAGCERDLAALRPDQPPGAGLLAVGGVDYENASPSKSPTDSFVSREDRDATRGTGDCARLSDARFDALAATGREVESIDERWNSSPDRDSRNKTILTGASATEEAFKAQSAGRSIIHVASHGFVLDGSCPGDSGSVDNPLVQVGVVFAGANSRARRTSVDDGILTGEETACLNLLATDLVFLSTCVSGLGRMQPGEGVMGLRRAFTVAGAASVVCSLWPVVDRVSLEWSERFYDQYLLHGAPADDAAHIASLEQLKTCREQGQSTRPGSWSAFVVSGTGSDAGGRSR